MKGKAKFLWEKAFEWRFSSLKKMDEARKVDMYYFHWIPKLKSQLVFAFFFLRSLRTNKHRIMKFGCFIFYKMIHLTSNCCNFGYNLYNYKKKKLQICLYNVCASN